MRTTLVLLSLTVFGCDDGGMVMNSPDLRMVLKDLSGTGAVDCDLLAQDCGAGRKCIPKFDGQIFAGSCVADGTVDVGMTCVQQMSSDSLLDNCKAGAVCDDILGASSLICRKICATDSECGSDKCGDVTFTVSGFGWCMPSCTPFSSAAGNCPANQDCGETAFNGEQPDPTNSLAGFFICKKTGTGTAFSSCMADDDCGAGLWCGALASGDGACLPNCDTTHMCGSAPADAGVGTLACQTLDGTPNSAGYCSEQ